MDEYVVDMDTGGAYDTYEPRVAGPARAENAYSYEGRFMREQAGIPTYSPCRCGDCNPSLLSRGRDPLRRETVDARRTNMHLWVDRGQPSAAPYTSGYA